jgi:hypothetical protein
MVGATKLPVCAKRGLRIGRRKAADVP